MRDQFLFLNYHVLYLNVIVGTIPTILDIEVRESEIYNMIAVDFQQPLAILNLWIILRIIGRVNDARVQCEFTTAFDGYGSVSGVKPTAGVRYVRVELHKHFVPGTGIDHRFV